MTKGIALLLSAAAGMLVAMQPPINSKLKDPVGLPGPTFHDGRDGVFLGTLSPGALSSGGRGGGRGYLASGPAQS